MSKKQETAGQKLYQNFMSQFWFIFLGRGLKKSCGKINDRNEVLVGFTLAFICNRFGTKKTRRIVWKNRKVLKWFFEKLESDTKVSDLVKIFSLDPDITIEQINSYKKIFNPYVERLLKLLSSLKIDLKIPTNTIEEIFKTAWIYLLYSLVDCAVEKTLALILADKNYENKIKMITKNTILFSNLRQLIMKNCGSKVNDFVTLINGMTKPLGKD